MKLEDYQMPEPYGIFKPKNNDFDRQTLSDGFKAVTGPDSAEPQQPGLEDGTPDQRDHIRRDNMERDRDEENYDNDAYSTEKASDEEY